uniref:Uncharacterized protein n=1 Tax=Arundo donax TaxID=35708 RepID=A0A0A9AAW8_ARUDO
MPAQHNIRLLEQIDSPKVFLNEEVFSDVVILILSHLVRITCCDSRGGTKLLICGLRGSSPCCLYKALRLTLQYNTGWKPQLNS